MIWFDIKSFVMGLLGLVCVDVVVIDDVWGLFVVGCSEIFEYGFDG